MLHYVPRAVPPAISMVPLGRDRSVSLAPPLFRGRSGGGKGRAENFKLAPAVIRSEKLLPY